MGVLAEYVKKEAEQLQAELKRQQEAAGEWFHSLERLYQMLGDWVVAADDGSGLLRAERKPGDIIEEPRIGVYTLDNLVISLGGNKSVVAPRARYVSAVIRPPGQEPRRADGSAVIRDGGIIEYHLFRLKEADGDRWYIQSDARWHGDPLCNDVDELSADRFEAAILRILQ